MNEISKFPINPPIDEEKDVTSSCDRNFRVSSRMSTWIIISRMAMKENEDITNVNTITKETSVNTNNDKTIVTPRIIDIINTVRMASNILMIMDQSVLSNPEEVNFQ